MILKALPALMFLILPSEGQGVRQAKIVKWSPEEASGVIRMVNLTHDAEQFITRQVRRRGTLKSFYFTGGYRPAREPPVTSKVNPLIYGAGSSYTAGLKNTKCKDVFIWNIHYGIVSPLGLRVNVTVQPIGRKKNVTVTLDINGASTLRWSTRNKNLIRSNVTSAIVEQECNFSAEVSFKGYVAYHLEDVRGDMPHDDAFNIVGLKNHTKGLEAYDNMLVYNVTGIFKHKLVCKDDGVTQHGKITPSIQ
uniref:Putative da-p36 protein n=1 Tax=Rhipicephalus pulchellus TaxID=72859 RepID=L7LTM5_RHIPC